MVLPRCTANVLAIGTASLRNDVELISRFPTKDKQSEVYRWGMETRRPTWVRFRLHSWAPVRKNLAELFFTSSPDLRTSNRPFVFPWINLFNTNAIAMPHMHLQIAAADATCQQGIGVLNLCSTARPSYVTDCWEALVSLTGSLRMFHFKYYDWQSSFTSACLANRWRAPFHVLRLTIKIRRLTGSILLTLLDVLDPPAFVLMKSSIGITFYYIMLC